MTMCKSLNHVVSCLLHFAGALLRQGFPRSVNDCRLFACSTINFRGCLFVLGRSVRFSRNKSPIGQFEFQLLIAGRAIPIDELFQFQSTGNPNNASLSHAKTFELFRCDAPELVHLPQATFEWYAENYLDHYYPIRYLIRFNGNRLPEAPR